MTIQALLASLTSRLEAYFVDGDPRPILAPEAVTETQQLWELAAGDDGMPYDVVELLAWTYWCRYQASTAPATDSDDRVQALAMFAMLIPGHPELLPAPFAAAVHAQPSDAPPEDLADLASLILDHPNGRGADEAIALLQQAIAAITPGHPRWAACHADLVRALGARIEEFGFSDDIDLAVDAARTAVTADPSPAFLFNLGRILAARFDDRDDIDALHESISTFRAGADAEDPGSPQHQDLLGSLAITLVDRFQRLDRSTDLDEAITIARAKLGADWLSTLGGWLQLRFERHNRMTDLDEAVHAGRSALDATPDDDPDLPERLGDAATALLVRFERLGDRIDIDEATNRYRTAVTASPGWQDVARGIMTIFGTIPDAALLSLNGLCIALRLRHERFGDLSDIDEAVAMGRGLLDATRHDDPRRVSHGTNLALSLRSRFDVTGDRADIEGAARLLREALIAAPADHPIRLQIETNLMEVLRVRFDTIGEPADLDEAIDVGRVRLSGIDDEHPDRPPLLMNLSGALLRRHEHTGDMTDLREALTAVRAAVALLPPDHPGRFRALGNLGDTQRTVYDTSGDIAALYEARTHWHVAAHIPTAPTAARLGACRAYATAAAQTGDWPGALRAGITAVDLLCRGAWHGLSRASREHHLTAGADVGTDAAASAAAIGDPETAVALIEQGRGVLWTNALDIRTDLTTLATRAPDLAARLTAVGTALAESA